MMALMHETLSGKHSRPIPYHSASEMARLVNIHSGILTRNQAVSMVLARLSMTVSGTHAAVVWNSVLGHIKYYHDGALYATVEVDKTNNPDLGQAGFNIGTHRAADGGRNWDGYLDEIAVFSIELSEAQIAGLYNQPQTVTPLNVITEIPDLTISLSNPVNTRVYKEDVVLSWQAPQTGTWNYAVWMGLDPNDMTLIASGLTDTTYTPADINDTEPVYYWKVAASSTDWDTIETDPVSFEIYHNQGLVAYWPFDANYTNVQGNTRYDGVEIDTANCIDISKEDVKRGEGALKINDNDILTYGLIQIPESPFFGGQKDHDHCRLVQI